MAMSANSKLVFDYVKECEAAGKLVTAKDIAAATGLTDKSVNGIITASFQRHREEINGEKVIVPLMERVLGEIPNEDGTHTQVKFIKLTDEGKNFVPEV